MKKQNVFSIQSLITTGKGIVVSFLAGLTAIIPFGIGIALRQSHVVISWIFYAIGLILEAFFWGWFANKIWKWK